jgi:serine/threonine protein kinase
MDQCHSHSQIFSFDLRTGKHLFIKLIRLPEIIKSQTLDAKQGAIVAELNTCEMLSKRNIIGLVKCDVVTVTVHHNESLNIPIGEWGAVKMKRYLSSLTDVPQLSQDWLYCVYSRIFKALKEMHELKLVHMDVKSDNVFVHDDSLWDLGDFGSTREIGAPIWSYTEVFNPYAIPRNATVIPSMDYVLLCVMIAVEMNKDKWKNLCGQKQQIQAHLVLEKLETIEDDAFRTEIVNLFQDNLKIVHEHLKKFNKI